MLATPRLKRMDGRLTCLQQLSACSLTTSWHQSGLHVYASLLSIAILTRMMLTTIPSSTLNTTILLLPTSTKVRTSTTTTPCKTITISTPLIRMWLSRNLAKQLLPWSSSRHRSTVKRNGRPTLWCTTTTRCRRKCSTGLLSLMANLLCLTATTGACSSTTR